MTGNLEGKVAIVTGAGAGEEGRGTGDAMSILFARQGANVVLVDIDEDRANRTLKIIDDEGGRAVVAVADLSVAADCQRAVATAVSNFGGVNILINNAAILTPGDSDVVGVSEEVWDQTFAVNVKSMMLMSKYVVPEMIRAGGGSIINLASNEGVRGQDWIPVVAYSTSKGSAITLTASMAVQHGKDNIRVNCIAPGMIYTPIIAPHISDEDRRRRTKAGPLNSEGTAWDVANAAAFLSSDDARWISGVTLPVDGGLLATQSLSLLRRFID